MLRTTISCALIVGVWMAGMSRLDAADVVNRKSVKQAVQGEITEISRTEVTVKPRTGNDVQIPVNDIASIQWDKEPAGFNLARSDEKGGRLQKAFDSFKKLVDDDKVKDDRVQADLHYFLARSTARMALADPKQVATAIKALDAYIKKFDDSRHYFEAHDLLGQLHLSKKDFDKAQTAYQVLGKAPWSDYQLASKAALARVLIEKQDLPGAMAAFDEVINAKASTPAEEGRRYEAMLGKARCLTQQKQFEEAQKLLAEVIGKSSPDDASLQAEAYLRQGDCLAAMDKKKEALLAYLHVDVLFAAEKSLHPEALYHLSTLWTAVGQPGRASEAQSKLETDYPNSRWTQQLKASDAAGG